ncbi:MAG TPA: acyl-CoA dehydrogenase family protein [Planococcus sp. (in: firmicutes)]|nr:acyl-CoA dehydrogenase family protein [Planococcus sp. (in: firmicutes)]
MSYTETVLQSAVQQDLLEKAEQLAAGFGERAEQLDREGSFPYENFDDLKEAGFLALTVPTEYGGKGIGLSEFLQIQERLAQGDAPTALSFGWQLGVILEAGETRHWKESSFARLCDLVVKDKALINVAQTERATGSASRGTVPTTTATKEGSQWRINGGKSFTSMAIALDYSIVTANVNGSGKRGFFLVDHKLPGVSVKETWDSMSMRGTKSDDLLLDNVLLDGDALLVEEDVKKPFPKGWYLQVPAVYLGIAIAARDYAVQFAAEYSPSSLPGPIIEVPEVRRKIGEMELELFNSKEILGSVAKRWTDHPELRESMAGDLAATKLIVTNSANRVVDLAMRIVGAQSLSAKNPLQRHFRDVRAGLHNPPTDDAIVYSLADLAIRG